MNCKPQELVDLVRNMLLTRNGEEITPALADERARNIATVLVSKADELAAQRNEAIDALRRVHERCEAAEVMHDLEAERTAELMRSNEYLREETERLSALLECARDQRAVAERRANEMRERLGRAGLYPSGEVMV